MRETVNMRPPGDWCGWAYYAALVVALASMLVRMLM
jgi:hypothetical protein